MTAVAVRPLPASPPEPGEIQPVEHEALHRTITGLVTGLPVLALGLAVWQAWDGLLRPGDLLVFAIVYVLTGLGVTVGFHRLFTHRSFKAHPAVRATLAVLGSAAIEGPAISWVADHRKHHAFSDRRAIRTARTSTTASVWPARCAACCTPTWAGCSATTSADRGRATRRTCSPTRRCASSTGPSSCGRWPAWRCRSRSGWPSADRCAPA